MSKTMKLVSVILLLIAALCSALFLTKAAASPEHYKKTIETLDEKRTTVMELTAAATAASATISLLPDDTCTPIAEKLADLSTGFLVVLCAIFLEKYLLSIIGFASFGILIPAAFVLYAIRIMTKSKACSYLATKVLLFGIAIYLVIPTSVKISNIIDDTYNTSIQETLDTAKQATDEISDETESEEDEGFWSGLVNNIKEGITGAVDKVRNIINNFIEALAVLIVTSCIIPLVTIMFFVWIIKSILGVNIDLTNVSRLPIWSKNKENEIE